MVPSPLLNNQVDERSDVCIDRWGRPRPQLQVPPPVHFVFGWHVLDYSLRVFG